MPPCELVDAALHAAIEAREYDLASALAEAGLGEDGPQGRAGPLSCAHRFTQPGLAHRPRGQTRAAIAGALERDRDRGLGARLDVVQAQAQRAVDIAADHELPRACVDHWDVEVDQQVVQADRRDWVVQRLERHRMVARGELELLWRDVRGRDERARGPRLDGLRQCLSIVIWRASARRNSMPGG